MSGYGFGQSGFGRRAATPVVRTRKKPKSGYGFGQDKFGGRAATPPGFGKKPTTATHPSPSPSANGAPTGSQSIEDILKGYYTGLASILTGIPGQIGSAYSDAAKEISGLAGGFSAATRQSLQDTGQTAEQQAALQAGSEFSKGIAGSYNAGPVGDTTYALGGYFPSSSLLAQGAAFKSGAELLPLKAYGEGLYSILGAGQSTKSAAYKASIISPSVSHLLGYVADAQGNPILDSKGKVVPVQASATAAGRARYHYMQPGDGFTYAYNPDTGQTTRVGPGPTKGQATAAKKHYQLKQPGDGFTYVFDPATSKYVKIGPGPKRSSAQNTTAAKNRRYASEDALRMLGHFADNPNFGKTVYPSLAAHKANPNKLPLGQPLRQGRYLADQRYAGAKDVFGRGTGNPLTTNNPAHAKRDSTTTFPQALSYLMSTYNITRAQARKILIAAGWRP